MKNKYNYSVNYNNIILNNSKLFLLNKFIKGIIKYIIKCAFLGVSYNNKDKIIKQAQENVKWFNKNNGISLAKKWMNSEPEPGSKHHGNPYRAIQARWQDCIDYRWQQGAGAGLRRGAGGGGPAAGRF